MDDTNGTIWVRKNVVPIVLTLASASFIAWAGWVSNTLINIGNQISYLNPNEIDKRISILESSSFSNESGLQIMNQLLEHERKPGHTVIVERFAVTIDVINQKLARIEKKLDEQ